MPQRDVPSGARERREQWRTAAVGAFLLAGLAALGLLAFHLGDLRLLDGRGYTLSARFVSASGLRPGAPVELAGVRVGEVVQIGLDHARYLAIVEMRISGKVRIQDDAIASIRTAGIIGDKFVKLSPGGSSAFLGDGMEILDTEPSISLEELISKYVFEGGGGK